jgi:diaminohydroxyphosphoribosylaminopyrimidine deaminase/5-amino-6-(5-phosphoribosylamino)uracil reductase
VIAAMEDPGQRVSGRGLAKLRAAGVEVEVGDGEAEAEALNPRYVLAARSGRPFVALKFAMTLDGKIATRTGESQWITGEPSRAEAHRLRQAYDAVAVGANTVITDDPILTARNPDGSPHPRQPLRVVVDGQLRVNPAARVLDPTHPGRSLVATTPDAYKKRGKEFEDRGITVVPFANADGVNLRSMLEYLRSHDVNSLMVEGGGEVAWSFLNANVVDRVYGFVAPRLLGGSAAPTAVGGEGFDKLEKALGLQIVAVRKLGPDILIEGVPS